MINIDYNTALSALNDAVAEKGVDFVYKKTETLEDEFGGDSYTVCAYLHHDEDGNLTVPGCIVGNVMVRLGVPATALVSVNTGTDARSMLRFLTAEGYITYTGKAAGLLSRVQGIQDGGIKSWSEAVVEGNSRLTLTQFDRNENAIGYDG